MNFTRLTNRYICKKFCPIFNDEKFNIYGWFYSLLISISLSLSLCRVNLHPYCTFRELGGVEAALIVPLRGGTPFLHPPFCGGGGGGWRSVNLHPFLKNIWKMLDLQHQYNNLSHEGESHILGPTLMWGVVVQLLYWCCTRIKSQNILYMRNDPYTHFSLYIIRHNYLCGKMTCLDHWFDVDECKWWQFFIKEHNFILIDFLMFVFFRNEVLDLDFIFTE
jgi:hypothetical protein